VADDPTIAQALVHDAGLVMTSYHPDNVGAAREVEGVKEKLRLAERLLAGKGNDETREAARGQFHPQTASLFGITS